MAVVLYQPVFVFSVKNVLLKGKKLLHHLQQPVMLDNLKDECYNEGKQYKFE